MRRDVGEWELAILSAGLSAGGAEKFARTGEPFALAIAVFCGLLVIVLMLVRR